MPTALQRSGNSYKIALTRIDGRGTAIVQAANRVAPAVVNVSVIARETVRPRTMWESFFVPPGSQRRSAGFGSGVIVRPDGIILVEQVFDSAPKPGAWRGLPPR